MSVQFDRALDLIDELEDRLDDPGVCHIRDERITSTFVSLCRVPPSGKVAGHATQNSQAAPYCAGCGRMRCPDCARIWQQMGGAA